MRILVIEDSERLRRSLGQGLGKAGFAVDLAGDGRQGLEFARAYEYDAIVLDLLLPGISGLEVLRTLRDGEPASLTPSEYAVFEYLVLRRGRVVSQQQLIDHLYHSDAEISSNVIEVLVSGLRKKIQRPGDPPIVRTRRGQGYIVDAENQADADEPGA